jgi:hypothetical protein
MLRKTTLAQAEQWEERQQVLKGLSIHDGGLQGDDLLQG